MSMRLVAMAVVLFGMVQIGCAIPSTDPNMEFKNLHDAYLEKYRPLVIEKDKAWWEASITGSDEAFKRQEELENQLVELRSNRETFAKLETLKEGDQIEDPILRRQLEVMYQSFLPGQADPELQKKIVALQTEVEKTFNRHRSDVGGRELTENEVREIPGRFQRSHQTGATALPLSPGNSLRRAERQQPHLRHRCITGRRA